MTPRIITYDFLMDRQFLLTLTSAASDWGFEDHRHNEICDVVLVTRGILNNRINGQRQRVPAGSLAWIRAADLHAVSGQNISFYNLNIQEERMHRLALALGQESYYKTLHEAPLAPIVDLKSQVHSLEQEFADLHRKQLAPEASLLLNQLLVRILTALFLPLVHQGADRPTCPDWMQRGMNQIKSKLDQGADLASLIRACGRSPEHVSRTFKSLLGMSPSAWINRQRLEYAALQLAGTNRDIASICFGLGFNNLSYFYRMFKKLYGITPRQYRLKANPFS